MEIGRLVEKQRSFFNKGKTLDVFYRKKALSALERGINRYRGDLCAAMKADLGKSTMEARMCEVELALTELKFVRKNLDKWARGKRVPTEISNFPGVSFTVQEPYGVVLIMAPWNYPFLLCIEPLIGALAAGNCVIIKPSAYAPATSRVIAKLVKETFPVGYIAVVEGGRAENEELLEQRFDYIFFTGSVEVGRLVMEKAAKHLTPVSLELGGKSPCIVDKTANLKLAAKRIAFGKYLNCGQTCVAPDYLLVEECVKDEFLGLLKRAIEKMYGKEPLLNKDYGHIVNRKHFERLLKLIDWEKVVYGGKADVQTLQIEPTVLDHVAAGDAIMGEEIFGPILPVLTFRDIREAEKFVRRGEKPLALYLFTERKQTERRFLKHVSFGGGCINDTMMHLASSHLGFGGVGNSGMGSYHGKKSFATFSHEKSILKKSTRLDVPVRYRPYTFWKQKCMDIMLK